MYLKQTVESAIENISNPDTDREQEKKLLEASFLFSWGSKKTKTKGSLFSWGARKLRLKEA